LDADGSPNYPNATYYMAKPEFEFWMSDRPDFSKSENPEIAQASIDLIRKTLVAIEVKLQLFEPGDQLFSCIHTESVNIPTKVHHGFRTKVHQI